MILIVYAHPYPRRSRGCAALLAGIDGLPAVEVRSLYELYPDFDIDVSAEHQALRRARRVVWMGPLFWYTVPALLKHWFDKVLVSEIVGDAALEGKECLWVATTGGGEYRKGGTHDHPFADFVPALEMTARYCGMRWLEPFVVHDPHRLADGELRERALQLRSRLEAPAERPG